MKNKMKMRFIISLVITVATITLDIILLKHEKLYPSTGTINWIAIVTGVSIIIGWISVSLSMASVAMLIKIGVNERIKALPKHE